MNRTVPGIFKLADSDRLTRFSLAERIIARIIERVINHYKSPTIPNRITPSNLALIYCQLDASYTTTSPVKLQDNSPLFKQYTLILVAHSIVMNYFTAKKTHVKFNVRVLEFIAHLLPLYTLQAIRCRARSGAPC